MEVVEVSFSVRVVDDTASQLLKSISENLRPKVHARIAAIGADIKAYSQNICPVRTGYLRSTIFFIVIAEFEYSFGADADYAIFVEMGTIFTPAQSFIRAALEAGASLILNACIEGFLESAKT